MGIIIVVLGVLKTAMVLKNKRFKRIETKDVMVVPTMQDFIDSDSAWCATFQLVWNDLKNEVVKQDIVFSPQEVYATNLNKEEFTEEMISDEYYYKIYGLKTLDLKTKIEKEIKEKFNQTSDILDQFDWQDEALGSESVNRYFFYTMLYREFEFLQKFDKLKNADFGNYHNIKYFGIDKNTKSEVKDQVEVLYYNSQNDFAILINTKSNDEVILAKNPSGNSFKEIYENMENKRKGFTGKTSLDSQDELKVPYLNFKILKDYLELESKQFPTQDGGDGEIYKALQTIEFSLNEKGGQIKSEAGIDERNYAAAGDKNDPRYFYVDNTFAIFLREKGEDMPFFAGKIEDITKFQ